MTVINPIFSLIRNFNNPLVKKVLELFYIFDVANGVSFSQSVLFDIASGSFYSSLCLGSPWSTSDRDNSEGFAQPGETGIKTNTASGMRDH